jgi:PAS domain S-box-containing protein
MYPNDNSKKQFNEEYVKNFLKHFYSPTIKEDLPELAFIETDLFGKIINITDEFSKITQKSPDTIYGEQLSYFIYSQKDNNSPLFVDNAANLSSKNKNSIPVFILCKQNQFISADLKILKKISSDGIVIGYSIILTKINKNEEPQKTNQPELQKNAILQALTFSSEKIIQASDNIKESIIFDILRHLGIAARANRVIIFKNTKNTYGSNLMELTYEWNSPGLFNVRKNSALHKYKYSNVVFNLMSRGEIYQKKVEELHESDELLLKDHLIKSFILIPLFSEKKLYGNLALADCQKVRVWTKEEIEGIEASARLIGQIINKINTNLNLPKEKHHKIKKTQAKPLCIIDKYAKIIFCSSGFEDLIGYSSAETINLPFTAFVKSKNNEFLRNFENIQISKYPVCDLKIKLRTSQETWLPVTIDMSEINSDDKNETLVQIKIKSSESDNTFLSLECGSNYDLNVDLSLILEKLPYPIWFTDKEKKFIYGNNAFFTKILAGSVDKKTLIGKKPGELPEKLNFLINIIAKDIKTNQNTLIERRLQSNKTHIFNIKNDEVHDYNNNFIGNLWYAEEETEVINANRKLIASEKKYKTILENIPGAVFLKDSKGQYIYANNYMLKSYKLNTLPSKMKNDVPECVVSKYTMEDLKAMREGKIETIDSVPEISGCSAIFKKIKFPVNSETGETLIGGIAIDITREKNLEEKISKYETRIDLLQSNFNSQLRNLETEFNSKIDLSEKKIYLLKNLYSNYLKFFHNSPILFFWCNLSGKIIFLNNTWKNYFPSKISDIKGLNLDSIFDHESRKRYYAIWRNILSKKIDYGFVDANIYSDKKLLKVSLYLKLADRKNDTSFPGIIVIAIPNI